MKRAFLASMFAFTLTTAAEAAPSVWRGDAFIVSSAGNCTNYNPAGGRYHVRYVPANVGENSTDSAFAWLSLDFAQGYYLANAAFSITPQKTSRRTVYDGIPGKLEAAAPMVSFDKQTPTLVKPSSKFITIEGTIANYDSMTGCTIKFRMALGASPN